MRSIFAGLATMAMAMLAVPLSAAPDFTEQIGPSALFGEDSLDFAIVMAAVATLPDQKLALSNDLPARPGLAVSTPGQMAASTVASHRVHEDPGR
tara:strand:- start:1543 stop:1827 length:285 start_codon:yes stop_codon:yes gene_type:complete